MRLAWLAIAIASAQTRSNFPDAKALIQRNLELCGGADAMKSVGTVIIRGRITFPSEGLSGPVTYYTGEDGETYQRVEVPGAGKTESGNNGEVEWEKSTVAGPKIVRVAGAPGGLLRGSPIRPGVDFSQFDVQTIGVERVDGNQCYQVRLKPKASGLESFHCYDLATGFLLRISSPGKLGDQSAPASSITMRDYRTVGKIKTPFVTEIEVEDQSFRINADTIEMNATAPPELFQLPEDIRILAERKKVDQRTIENADDPERPRLKRKTKKK